jgi:hypothetical protein
MATLTAIVVGGKANYEARRLSGSYSQTNQPHRVKNRRRRVLGLGVFGSESRFCDTMRVGSIGVRPSFMACTHTHLILQTELSPWQHLIAIWLIFLQNIPSRRERGN